MKSKVRRLIHTACLVIMAVCAVVVTVKICTIQTASPTIQEEKTAAQQAFDSADYTALATPYGDLYFPKPYEEYLETQVSDENGVYKMTFYYKSTSGNLELYTVCFGDGTFGQAFGRVGANTAFTVQFADTAADPSWTEDEALRLSAMREAINDILKSVEFFDGYQK